MKNHKGLIIVAVILVIYGIIMFVLFGTKNNVIQEIIDEQKSNENINKEEKYYLVLDDKTYQYNHDKKKFVSVKNSYIQNLDKLKVYINNYYYGKYKMEYVDSWNLLNDKGEFVKYNGSIIAGTENLNLDVRENKIRELNEQDKIFLINNYNVSSFAYLTTNQVMDIDLDKNGVMDEIICLSSKEYSTSNSNYFDLVLIKFNNEVFEIINKKENNDNAMYNLMASINYFKNDYDSIYISKTNGIYAENSTFDDYIINYKNGKYSID